MTETSDARERLLAAAAERLREALKAAKAIVDRQASMQAKRMAGRRYLADFEAAWRAYPRQREVGVKRS
jgi:hypothetical protein